MRLLHVTTWRLSLFTALLLTFWSVFFYVALMEEINDEVDDSLEDYAEMIITRSLRGEPLPKSANGTSNYYYQREVTADYAAATPHVRYTDREIRLAEKNEIEPARLITYIYMCADGSYRELVVATPNIDKADLRESIAFWMLFLYLMLLLSIVGVNLWGVRRTMRPLNRLLAWLDRYRLGQQNEPLDNPTRIREFRKLNATVTRSMERGEELYEQQKVFIGNASHEMQTPIAVCQNRIEMLLDDEGLTEEQMGELIKVRRTLGQLSQLNRSLLMLCKIENGQFTRDVKVNLTALIAERLSDYESVYSSRNITTEAFLTDDFGLDMDETLASVLVSNLLKNAYVHNCSGGMVRVKADSRSFTVENSGEDGPLDTRLIFQRFYHSASRSSSTGLGLPMVEAVCKRYGLEVDYRFVEGMHRFTVSMSDHRL